MRRSVLPTEIMSTRRADQHQSKEQQHKVAGLVAVTCAITQVFFQAVIAIGLPVGKAAWGGASAEVSTGLRIASAVASVVYLFFASVLVQVGGLRDFQYSEIFASRVIWLLSILMILGSVANWASRSPLERYIWGPFATVFAFSCLVLTRSFPPKGNAESRGGLSEGDQLI